MNATPIATATALEMPETNDTALGLCFCSADVPAPKQAVYVPIATTVPTKNVPRNATACKRGSANAGSNRSNASGCNPWIVPVMYVQLKNDPSVFLRRCSSVSIETVEASAAALEPSLSLDSACACANRKLAVTSPSSCECECECVWPSPNMSFPMPNGNPCECECECEWLSPLAIALASHQPMIPIITSVPPTIPWPHCPMISMLNGSLSFRRTNTKPKSIWPVLCPQPHSAPINAFCARDGPTVKGANAAR
mmetsp:Transcript_8497/g.35501  ORF Transcript_8497/g.35501 Transcript_8497/m.35501 type:complete len:253 (+) Transcript_8497:151-909(+)